jgi:hypothetical protein
MDHEETPDMVYGRLREAAHVSGYTFERACEELEYLLTDDRWQQVGPGYPDINAFLRSVDFSPFNLQNRPQLVRRIKELQPEASNRAIAEAIGVSEPTVRRDVNAASFDAPEPDDEEEEDVDDEADEGVELPAFLCGEDWTLRERAQAYALYLGLPADLQPTVAALLGQPGICAPDIRLMLEQITRMDEPQRQELARLQASADAYERSCAITMALNRPPPPHPRVMLLYEARRELMALSRRVGSPLGGPGARRRGVDRQPTAAKGGADCLTS